MLRARDLAGYVSIGIRRAMEWGKLVGADRRFGRLVLYDRKAVDQALDRMTPEDNAFEGITTRKRRPHD